MIDVYRRFYEEFLFVPVIMGKKTTKHDYVYQTSWGLTTRSIGTAIMTYNCCESNSLTLLTTISEHLFVIIPIYKTNIQNTLSESI